MAWPTSDRNGDARAEFRAGVQAWLNRYFPKALAGKDSTVTPAESNPELSRDEAAWKKVMGNKGWGVPTWPREYGGGGLEPAEARILSEEMARIGAWNPITGMGVMMLGPILLEYGSETQKRTHLPPIARGEIRWCQGYSEPGAGSDLASLQTYARDAGDHYVVNGQKTWTSGAQFADKCFALVRTDRSRKHEGISFMLIDMKAPGVLVRPIRMISGQSPFCETFFTDVMVPKENLVGQEGQGWTIGKRLLQHERQGLSSSGSARPVDDSLGALARRYREVRPDGRLADEDLRIRIVRHEMDARAFRLTQCRVARDSKSARGPSEATSILKNVSARVMQESDELTLEIKGLAALGLDGDGFTQSDLAQTRNWLFNKAATIYGGSFEVQNNIIAKRILGMNDHQ